MLRIIFFIVVIFFIVWIYCRIRKKKDFDMTAVIFFLGFMISATIYTINSAMSTYIKNYDTNIANQIYYTAQLKDLENRKEELEASEETDSKILTEAKNYVELQIAETKQKLEEIPNPNPKKLKLYKFFTYLSNS